MDPLFPIFAPFWLESASSLQETNLVASLVEWLCRSTIYKWIDKFEAYGHARQLGLVRINQRSPWIFFRGDNGSFAVNTCYTCCSAYSSYFILLSLLGAGWQPSSLACFLASLLDPFDTGFDRYPLLLLLMLPFFPSLLSIGLAKVQVDANRYTWVGKK